jgi:hypothetical protein
MMMETIQTKVWPDAKVDGEYIGSFRSADGEWCDFYLDGETGRFEWGRKDTICARISEIEQSASRGLPNCSAALMLIRAHRAKQAKPEPPAPVAMTRTEMIEAVAMEMSSYAGRKWFNDDWSPVSKADWRLRAARVVDRLHPELIPKPEPEPVKKLPTAEQFLSELAYEGRIRGLEAASWDEIQEKFQGDDARDRKHAETMRKELEALRDACTTKAVKTLVKLYTSGQQTQSIMANAVYAVPLTIADREAAK